MSDDLIARLRDESDLCRSETASDIAALIDEAADRIAALTKDNERLRDELHKIAVQSSIGAAQRIANAALSARKGEKT